jgi:hypothetical protein
MDEELETQKLQTKDLPKYEAIKDMLRAAGYFRVRMTTLTPFDKVVGGLCWCISNSNANVDVDVNFDENPDIRAKISISEQIITSLKLMGCNLKIEPVQIQGLDFEPIYNVFQWLIKKVFETREENREKIIRFSNYLFDQQYHLESEKTVSALTFENDYKISRKFKSKKKRTDPLTHVQTVLMEYGREFKTKGDGSDDQEDESLTNAGASISASNLSKILVTGSGDNILKEKQAYEQKSREFSQIEGTDNKFRHKQITAQLKKQIENFKQAFLKIKQENGVFVEKKNALSAELKKYRDYNQKIQEKIAQLDDVSEDPAMIQLKRLVTLNESLKKQEEDFRELCKRQLKEWLDIIAKLENHGPEFTEFKELEKNLGIYEDKLKKIKQLSSKRNREIAFLTRKIDEVPSRIEINQYEKRFKELYGQIVFKLDETRKYYDMYNCLSETLDYMKKESSLLSSINDGFQKTVGKKVTKEYRQWLVDTSKKSVEAVLISKGQVDKRVAGVVAKRDGLQDSYNKLVAQQRRYYAVLKDFQDECKKNELIRAKIGQ